MRAVNLRCIGLVFGRAGELALCEYYAQLADPAEFQWHDAVVHIAGRLGLDAAELLQLWADSEPVERAILAAIAAGRRG